MKTGTVALIVRLEEDQPVLIEALSDDREIKALEEAFQSKEPDPLLVVHEFRSRVIKEEEEFGDYVEELLSQPFIRPEIQKHGVDWLESRIRIEQYKRTENQATSVIAEFALKLFHENNNQNDFILAGPSAKVRVRIFQAPKTAITIDKRGAA